MRLNPAPEIDGANMRQNKVWCSIPAPDALVGGAILAGVSIVLSGIVALALFVGTMLASRQRAL